MANRIESLLQTEPFAPFHPALHNDPRPSTASDSCHCWFTPLHYEASYSYPLLIWLHSHGADEYQLKSIMPLISVRNYVAVAPRGTLVSIEEDGQRGFHWAQSLHHITRAGQRILGGLELAQQKYNIDPRRVFLAGCGAGGTMAFRMAMQYPHAFAGVLSIGGPFPVGQAPLAKLQQARRLPLLISCGRDSAQYSTEQVCDDLRLFHTAGLAATVRQYPCGDEIIPQMLADANRWIMEQLQAPAQRTRSQPFLDRN